MRSYKMFDHVHRVGPRKFPVFLCCLYSRHTVSATLCQDPRKFGTMNVSAGQGTVPVFTGIQSQPPLSSLPNVSDILCMRHV
ncbi:hypothetical protein DFH09DRAFT_1128565, partial [Mycena vulgaris]